MTAVPKLCPTNTAEEISCLNVRKELQVDRNNLLNNNFVAETVSSIVGAFRREGQST
jgi:hypothetical protein